MLVSAYSHVWNSASGCCCYYCGWSVINRFVFLQAAAFVTFYWLVCLLAFLVYTEIDCEGGGWVYGAGGSRLVNFRCCLSNADGWRLIYLNEYEIETNMSLSEVSSFKEGIEVGTVKLNISGETYNWEVHKKQSSDTFICSFSWICLNIIEIKVLIVFWSRWYSCRLHMPCN